MSNNDWMNDPKSIKKFNEILKDLDDKHKSNEEFEIITEKDLSLVINAKE